MLAFTISIILFNLALGYLSGAVLQAPSTVSLPSFGRLKFPQWPRWRLRLPAFFADWRAGRRATANSEQAAAEAAPAGSNATDNDATGPVHVVLRQRAPVVEEIPREWLDALSAEGQQIEVKTYVEAAAQVLRLEVARYREQLVECDDRARNLHASGNGEALPPLLNDLKRLNLEWLDKQAAAAAKLHERQQSEDSVARFGTSLEDTLVEQQAQIETTCNNLEHLDLAAELTATVNRLLDEIGRLLDLAHALRDRMQETLTALMWADGRIGTVERRMQIDSLTELLNRAGLERVLYEWWRDDPSRKRMLSLALIDIDRLGHYNVAHGPRLGDNVIQAISEIAAGQIRDDRGFERLGRLEGQRLLAVFGDAGPQHATSVAERIRQTIEATDFHHHGQETRLVASCGVVEASAKDDVKSVTRRLVQTLREAKKAGRNRTYLDKGEGPGPTSPPEFNVRPRVVELDAPVPV